MWQHDCGSLPVVEDDGTLVGIITDRDICIAAYLHGMPLASIPVLQAMARNVYSCLAGDPIGVAERIMSDHQVRRVPVVDPQNRVVGMVSLTDLAREAEDEVGQRTHRVSEGEVTRTLAAICQPKPIAPSAPPPS
jgi:CBS domain-containing protein